MSDENKNTTGTGVREPKAPKPGTKEDLQARLAAAEAKLAALKAAQQTDSVPEGDPAQKVKVFIPRGASNDEPNLFVSVNGVNYLLPKGKESEVPAFVAAEIERSNKAAQVRDMKKDQMLGTSKPEQ